MSDADRIWNWLHPQLLDAARFRRHHDELLALMAVARAEEKATAVGRLREHAWALRQSGDASLAESFEQAATYLEGRRPLVTEEPVPMGRGVFGSDIDIGKLSRELERYRLLHAECVVCKAALQDPTDPPHCQDTCVVDDEHREAWEDALDALEKP